MIKRYSFAIGLCILAGWLAGCGGQSGTLRSSHGSGTVKLKITIPPRAVFVAKAPGGRLIPGNTATLRISYTAVDATTGTLDTYTIPTPEGVACPAATTGVICVSVTPAATPTTVTETLTGFAAGYANIITVDALDGNNNKVAMASTTINITPGDTATQAAVTLATTIPSTGTPVFSVVSGQANALTAGLNASQSVTVAAQFKNQDGNTITPAQSSASPPVYGLTWTASSPSVSLQTNAANGNVTITALQPGFGSVVKITVTYQEYGQTIQTGSFNLTLNNPTLSPLVPPSLSYKRSDATNLATTALFDVSSDGNTLLYDSTLKILTNDAFAGYSRIAPRAATFPPASDVVDFDTKTAPTYVGANSRSAFLPAVAGGAWAVVGGGGTNNTTVTAFASGDTVRGVTVPPALWTYTPGGGTTIIDLDAKGGTANALVYLLEQTGASTYQIVTIKQATGAVSGSAIPVTLGYAPTNLAVILVKNGSTLVETDYYLSGASHIAQLRVPVSGVQTLQADFTNSAVTPLDIATSDDGRFLFELDGAGKIAIFSTADGTQAPATQNLSGTIITPGVGVTGSRLGAGITGGITFVYVLDQNAGVTQIESYQLQ